MNTEAQKNGQIDNPSSYKWKAFATVALATVMGAIDFTFVNLSYPILTKTFKTELATVVWLNLIFSLVLISLGPMLGKINDLIGRKKVFVIGLALSALGLITCSISQTIGQLILFRIIHAIGNAATSTCYAAIITDAFPQNELGKGLGLQNASLSLGFIVGPLLGGILLHWLGWRSIFYIRIPVGIILFIMALILLRKDEPVGTKIRFDFIGTLTSLIGFFSLILGVSLISQLGLQSPVVYTLIIAGLLFLGLFFYVERKVEDPIVNLSLFKNRAFLSGILSLLINWIAVQGSVVTMPFYIMESLGLSAYHAGLLFTVAPIIMVVVSPISGSLSDRLGAVSLAAIGVGIGLVSLFIMYTYDPQTPIILIIFVSILGGVASGTFLPANSSLIMGSVKPENRGSASALIASTIGLGLSLGMAWASTVYSMRKISHQAELTRQGVEAALAANQSIHLAFHDAIIISIFLAFMVLICSLLPKLLPSREE